MHARIMYFGVQIAYVIYSLPNSVASLSLDPPEIIVTPAQEGRA